MNKIKKQADVYQLAFLLRNSLKFWKSSARAVFCCKRKEWIFRCNSMMECDAKKKK